MPRLLPPLSSSSPRAARAAWRRLAVAVVLGCGLTISAGGCGATRQKVMRPVTGAIRSVPGMDRIMPHAGPPAPMTPPPPPPTIGATRPESSTPSHRWEPGSGEPFAAPRDYNLSPPLPAPPNPLPGGAGRPMLIGPPTDSSPSDRGVPSYNDSAAPPPAPAPTDPSAYYPVGRGRVRESVSSLWRRLSSPVLGGSEEPADTKLVSHEAAEDDDTPREGWRFSDSLIRLGRPTVESAATDGEK